MNFKFAAQPTGTDIVSLADMKLFLRVDHSADDAVITAIIDAAAQSIQDFTGRHFKTTTWTLSLRSFYDIEAPYSVSTVTSVSYYSPGDTSSKVLHASKYYSALQQGILKLNFLDTPTTETDTFEAVIIAGAVSSQITAPLTHAIKMLSAHFYENRRAVVVGTGSAIEIPLGVKAIINPYRLINLR